MYTYRINMLLVAVATTILSTLFSCDSKDSFTIKGTVSNANGKMLYISNIGVDRIVRLDSVKLKKNGTFEFSLPRPECYDFYRLGLGAKGRQITIAIDSVETVVVETDALHFADSCKIIGSLESVKIKELEKLEMALKEQVDYLIENTSPAIGETRSAIYNLIADFKRSICNEYIIPGPNKASAYYALFLRLNGEPIFDPLHNRFDSKCFSAVATSLNNIYPHATRAMHLYNVAVKGIKTTRPNVPKDTLYVSESKIKNVSLFDIELPNIDGDTISLTSLKGKVVLLDFTVYGDARISSRNLELRELYADYKERGFEIYQVSLDGDKHFWQISAENLPWICVHDENSFASSHAMLYRVDHIPTFFLINRENELVYRDEQVDDVRKTIETLLADK